MYMHTFMSHMHTHNMGHIRMHTHIHVPVAELRSPQSVQVGEGQVGEVQVEVGKEGDWLQGGRHQEGMPRQGEGHQWQGKGPHQGEGHQW